MTCTREQIRNFLKYRKLFSLEKAAAKAGMSTNTARKYLRQGGKSLVKQSREYRTRRDPFADVWDQVEQMLNRDQGLEAKTLLEWLFEMHPGQFRPTHLRTLQRRVATWKITNGKDKEIYFPQNIQPGLQSQSDHTCCNELNVTIGGAEFEHLLFHFMLPYSRWEAASIAYSESYQSLTDGYSRAVKELGGVAPEHRTDNLAAAVPIGERKAFQRRWRDFLNHYGVRPTANNPYQSNENGSVEKSHDLLKSALDQRLRLRGSRDFSSLNAYEEFVQSVVYRRNKDRKQALAVELKLLKSLPRKDWHAPQELFVSVRPWSTVSILRSIYSVPSRLIGARLRAYVYANKIELYYGKNLVEEMPRIQPGELAINYRHIIKHLVRKPGAFKNYQFRNELFPTTIFRKAYDQLETAGKSDKEYLKILHVAAMEGESQVETALTLLFEMQTLPSEEAVKDLLQMKFQIPEVTVSMPELSFYDSLLRTELIGATP